jgi:hypothetical protein
MEGMADGGASPEREDNQEVRHECQRTASPGIPGMEPLYQTAVPLPYIRLLLVGKVRACLPAAGANGAGWAVVALSESGTLLPGIEDRVQSGGDGEFGYRLPRRGKAT